MTLSLITETATDYATDLAILSELRGYLLDTLHQHERQTGHFLEKSKTWDDRHLRVYFNNRRKLLDLDSAFFVGFMGEKRENIRAEVNEQVSKLDFLMTRELTQYPFILAYCSLELPDRYNYANLVILSGLESLGQWKETPFHRAAAREMSPEFYRQARIHVGALKSGLLAAFDLIRTSLYDFDTGQTRLNGRKIY